MSAKDFTRILGGWEGYRIGKVDRPDPESDDVPPKIVIELCIEPGRAAVCSGCMETVPFIHDCSVRCVRDLPVFEYETHLLVQQRRVACPKCGSRVEHIPWLERYARHTLRLGRSVAALCQVMTVQDVARFYGLNRRLVKEIDLHYLKKTLGEVDLDGLETIVMDEFAIQKGHRYATVIIEPEHKRVLWICRGRSKEEVRPFFKTLGKKGCDNLKAVAMDMNAAYARLVGEECPKAEIVYDLFHVVAKYGREVIDRVRIDEANRLRGDRNGRKVVKSSRWLLLRNSKNVRRREDRIRLKELLAANKALMKVYVLKDDLKHLWDYKQRGAALKFWRNWYKRAIYSRIEPLKNFARNLKTYIDGILSHCRWPLHTSLLEGINNKIKVIKRKAYGFRDDEYFFLKIRQAFPGKCT